MKVLAKRRKVDDCFGGYDWNLRMEGKDKTWVKMEKQKKKKIAFEKWKLNFLRFHQFSHCTCGFFFDRCTKQHNMQGASSASLTDFLDGGTILMDVREIQGRNWYFEKFGDDFGWCLQIQGRSWWFTPKISNIIQSIVQYSL